MSLTDARVLDHDSATDTTEYYHYDPHSGGFVIETVQDVTALVDQNTRLWNASEKHTKYGELTRVSSVPNTVLMELAKLGILSIGGAILDDAKYRRWLNDPANLKWRTRAGKV